MMVVLEVHV